MGATSSPAGLNEKGLNRPERSERPTSLHAQYRTASAHAGRDSPTGKPHWAFAGWVVGSFARHSAAWASWPASGSAVCQDS